MNRSAVIRVACLWAAVVGGGGLCAWRAAAQDATPAQLEEQAHRLGDADARVRDEAAAALRAAGPTAEAALRAVAESGDPEAARRAKRLLQELRQPAPEELPPDDAAELQAYRAADRDGKLRLIQNELSAANGGTYRAGLLARLWAEEPDEALRAAMFASLLQAPAASATALVAAGNPPAAERLLETALARRNAEAAAPYAALAMLRGELDKAIEQWTARAPAAGGDDDEDGDGANVADPTPAAVLANLHRANGDPRGAAAAHALAAGDPDLALQSLLDARDWPAAAEAVRADPDAMEPGKRALLAGILRAAGDDQGVDEIARWLARLDEAEDAAHALLLLGRTDEALRVLTRNGLWLAHFKTLEAQDRLPEAFALLMVTDAVVTEDALSLRVAAAQQLHELGRVAEAGELLTRVARENETVRSIKAGAALGTAARRMGMAERAWEYFLAAAKLEGERDGDVNWSLWQAFKVEDAEVDGRVLWQMLAEWFADEPLERRLARARSVLDRTIPVNELTDLAGAHDEDGGVRAHVAHLHREAGQRMRDAGDEAGAIKYMEAAAKTAPAPEYAAELFQRAGDWAAEKQDWAGAARWYARAWNVDRTAALPLYLRGWALRQAGWHARSGELLNLAHVLPLADAAARYDVMEALHERGMPAELAREANAVIRTARADQSSHLRPADFARRYAAELALRASDPLGAAAAYERSILSFLEFVGAYGFAEQSPYVRLPHTAGRLRAKGLLARGDVAAAEREIAACRAMIPGDVMLAIDVVPEFERLGDRARADALYAEAMAAQEAILKLHPDSASHHNSLAWLAVVCGRDGDKAMEHARRAVALRPGNASSLDTLAEAQFRRGEIDEAIKTMTRCAELEPKVPRHREQLERFAAAKRGEQRAMPPG
jgi:hypothetical protein